MKNSRLFVIGGLIMAALAFIVGAIGEANRAGASAGLAQVSREATLNENECTFAIITVTSNLGISPGVSDTLTGGAGDRVVYFSNPNPTGVITLSTSVSDVLTSCYVWASPAFSVTTQAQFTPTASIPAEIAYPVGDTHGPTVTVVLTSSPNITGSELAPHQVVTLTFVQDTTPPTSTLQAAGQSFGRTPVQVDWSANDGGSGVISLTLLYRQWPTTTWTVFTTQAAIAPTGTFAFVPPTVWLTGPITYELTSQAGDHVGNLEAAAWHGVSVQVFPAQVYLPLVARNYKPLVNGDFELGWSGWTHGQGPFLGHGTGLSQTIVLTGTYRALLGDPRYDNKNFSIPVGYAYMSQEFTVPPGTPILSISYRVHSLDTSFGISTTQYFDTFEVSINKPSDQITDTERDGSNGCKGSALNPDNVTRTPAADGLIICAGAPAAAFGGTPWDSGWRTVRLDLSAFAGQNVTLYFANWSREYESSFQDDRAYYNTYTYVDDVTFVQGP